MSVEDQTVVHPVPGGVATPVSGRVRRLTATTSRFGLAIVGPVAVAASNTVLQFAMLKTLQPAAFGLVAFVLGLTQFGFGLSNALVGTPYTLDANADRSITANLLLTYLKGNLILSVLWGLLCFGTAAALGSVGDAALFGVFEILAMLRWFGRSHLYALHRPTQVALSDLTYAAVLLVGAGFALVRGLSMGLVIGVLCAASLAGLLAVGRDFLTLQFRNVWGGSLRHYGTVWREQARWTLVGVVSTEATSNAHSYAVSLIAGPAAFAPIAAASLFIKPIGLVITSLTQLERPVMARKILAGDLAEARRTERVFRAAVLVAWAGTTVLASVVLLGCPQLLIKPSYDLKSVELAFALWTAIALLQCWATPSSVLLQAAQWFKALALSQVASAVVTLLVVIVATLVFPAVLTLGGILLGQAVMTVGIAILVRRWMADRASVPAG